MISNINALCRESHLVSPSRDAHGAHAVGAVQTVPAPADKLLRNETVAADPPAEHNRAVFMN
jgi:hypothetical protein